MYSYQKQQSGLHVVIVLNKNHLSLNETVGSCLGNFHSKPPNQGLVAQEAFKKILIESLIKIPGMLHLIRSMFGFKMKLALDRKTQRHGFVRKKDSTTRYQITTIHFNTYLRGSLT